MTLLADFEKRMPASTKASDSLPYLKAFYAILDFEVNRPYEHWYQRKAKLKTTKDIADLLKQVASEDKIEGAQEYFQDIRIIPDEEVAL